MQQNYQYISVRSPDYYITIHSVDGRYLVSVDRVLCRPLGDYTQVLEEALVQLCLQQLGTCETLLINT